MFNRTRSLTASPEVPPTGSAGRGPCECSLYEQDPAVHDMLLGVGRNGLAGVVVFLEYVESAHGDYGCADRLVAVRSTSRVRPGWRAATSSTNSGAPAR